MIELLQMGWLDYKKRCLPQNEAEHVLMERRRMFMAGARTMMTLLESIPETATEDQGARILSLVEAELRFNGTTCGTDEERKRL